MEVVCQSELAATVEEECKPELSLTEGKKNRRHRRRHHRPSNRSGVAMSDASTRSGSPSSSEAAVSRRNSVDTAEPDKPIGVAVTQSPPLLDTPPRPVLETVKDVPQCPLLTFTSPVNRPCPLSPAAIGDASSRQPMSRLGTPVSSPSKGYAPFGGRLMLPSGGLTGEPFQPTPAGTPAATPVARYTVTSTSPGMSRGAVMGDASARTPGASPMAGQSVALTSWLCGSPSGRLPSGPELTELLRKALPEAYDD